MKQKPKPAEANDAGSDHRPNLKPRRTWLIATATLFTLWTLFLLYLYFSTVYAHRTPGALTNLSHPLH